MSIYHLIRISTSWARGNSPPHSQRSEFFKYKQEFQQQHFNPIT